MLQTAWFCVGTGSTLARRPLPAPHTMVHQISSAPRRRCTVTVRVSSAPCVAVAVTRYVVQLRREEGGDLLLPVARALSAAAADLTHPGGCGESDE